MTRCTFNFDENWSFSCRRKMNVLIEWIGWNGLIIAIIENFPKLSWALVAPVRTSEKSSLRVAFPIVPTISSFSCSYTDPSSAQESFFQSFPIVKIFLVLRRKSAVRGWWTILMRRTFKVKKRRERRVKKLLKLQNCTFFILKLS